MVPMRLTDLARVVGGTVHDAPAELVVTAPATVDSRQVEPGGLFVAFVGEHVDGHDFASAALTSGAAAVLCSRPVGVPAVVVPDVQAALGALAAHVLAALRDRDRAGRAGCRVVAITGSQGKTSTKDMLAVVLAQAGRTVATHGSLNNEIGLPLTVLRADAATRHLVLEMGARGGGHLRALCALAPPDVSLVLNVGKAHLGEFGSQDQIAAAKGELVEALDPGGTAVLNADDQRVAAMRSRTRARVLTFGEAAEADVQVSDLRLDDAGRPGFTLAQRVGGERAHAQLQLVGAHQAANAAAAAAVAVACGITLEQAASALASVTALSRWRMEVSHRADGVTVVNDAYNANPDSMAAALASLVALGSRPGPGPGPGRRRAIAVLGEMRELGASSADEHRGLGTLVGRLMVRGQLDRLLVVGDAASAVQEGAHAELAGLAEREARERGRPVDPSGREPVLVADNEAAVRWLADHVRPGDVVLVKASRGARLDEVADALLHGPVERGARG